MSASLGMPVAEVLSLDIWTFGSICDSLGRIEAGRLADLAQATSVGQDGDALEDYVALKNWEQGFEKQALSGAQVMQELGGGF